MAACNDRLKVFDLGIESELQFVVQEDASASLTLTSGFAEILGTELTQNKVYNFRASSSVSLFTWKGCQITLDGSFFNIEIIKTDPWLMLYVSMHACLQERRVMAEKTGKLGPISLVVGPSDVGKTSFCYTVLNYAARMNKRPVFVDLDVGQNSISVPGTISVLPIKKQSDVESGFDQEEVAIYHFGHKSPGFNIKLYFLFIKMLGPAIRSRIINADPNTRSSGVVIDTCSWVKGDGYRAIALAARSFEVDNLFVFEDEDLYVRLKEDMPTHVEVVFVHKFPRVIERDRYIRSERREKRMEEYFYGPTGRINPCKIEVSFNDLIIYKVNSPLVDDDFVPEDVHISDVNVEAVSFGTHLEKHILGLSFADDVTPNLIVTNVIGFVCVMKVDMDKKMVTLLSPKRGPLPGKICILGHLKLRCL